MLIYCRKGTVKKMNKKTKSITKKVMNKVASSDAGDIVTFLGFFKPKRPSALNKNDSKANK